MTNAKHPLFFLLGLILALGLIVTSTLAFAADTSCGVVYVVDGAPYPGGWHKRVQKFDTNGKFLGKWSTVNCSGLGPSDCRDGRPAHPGDRLADQGIAIDSKGYVYVQNVSRNKIQKFDSNGKLITSWGIRDCSGISQTGRACNTPDITINSDDILLATDSGRRQIDRYDTDGSPVQGNPPRKVAPGGDDTYSTFAKSADVGNAAYGIATDREGNTYVASRSLPGIKKFNSKGELVLQWGTRADGSASRDGKFYQPTGVAVAPDGNVYVTDHGPVHPVQVFTPKGEFIRGFGVNRTGKSRLDSANFIAVDHCGNVYVTQRDNCPSLPRYKWKGECGPESRYGNWVIKYSPEGKLLTSWGGRGSDDGLFIDPGGIAIGKGSGRPKAKAVADTAKECVFVGHSSGKSTVNVFDKSGKKLRIIGAGGEVAIDYLTSFDVSNSGYIYTVEHDRTTSGRYDRALKKFDVSGKYISTLERTGGSDASRLASVAVDQRTGNFYVAYGGSAPMIKKFDPEAKHLLTWGGRGRRKEYYKSESGDVDGKFSDINEPTGITVDSNSNVYVTDNFNSRIQKFDKDGKFLLKWGARDPADKSTSDGDYAFWNGPSFIASDQANNLYIPSECAGSSSGRTTMFSPRVVKKYDASGKFLLSIGAPKRRTAFRTMADRAKFTKEGNFRCAARVGVSKEGDIYVSDMQEDPEYYVRIQKFDSSGKFKSVWKTREHFLKSRINAFGGIKFGPCELKPAGGLTVGSFTSAASTTASVGKVKLYQHYNYEGIEKGYGVGDHVWIGDTYSGYLGLSSFKIPKGLSVTFYEGKGLTGKSYGPFDGALSYNCLGCAKHPLIPNDKIFSLKVTDISTKAKREAEAEKRAKAEADKKAAVAKAKAAAELAKKKEECKADVVFLMDNTGSMSPVIKATKKSAAKILNKIAGADPRFKGLNVQFGVATYWGDPKEHKCETKETGVKLYQHWHYGGKEKTYSLGMYSNITDVFHGGLGVSSFKLPSGLSLYMYSKKGGEGTKTGPFDGPLDIPCLAYPGGPYCPHKHAVNDNVRSIKVEKTKGVRLYSHASYNTRKEPSVAELFAAYEPPTEACKADGTAHGVWIIVDSKGKHMGGKGASMVCTCKVCGPGKWTGPPPYIGGAKSLAALDLKLIWEGPSEKGGMCADTDCTYDFKTGIMSKSDGRMRKDGEWITGATKVTASKTGRRSQQYGVGDHASISSVFPSGSALGVSSVKVPTGFELEMYEKANFKGRKFGPFSGSHDIECMATDTDCKHSAIPDNTIASIKVTGGIDLDEGFKECARKAYKVNQPLTKSKESAASAMNQWKACSAPGGCGDDIPEANFFALQQLATEGEITDKKGTSDKGFASGYKVGWREDAGRVVVWFGDAPSHTTTVDKEEAVSALLDNEIVVSAINTKDKYTGLDSSGGIEGIGGLPHFCSIKSCLFSGRDAWICDYYACEKGGICSTDPEYDCSVLDKANPPGQATQITVATRGKVHHKITGDGKVVKTILEATAVGIADAGVGSAVTFTGGFLARDSKVFFGTMNPKGWSGDVQAWPLNEETAAVDVGKGKVWSAAEKIDAGSPASRVMLSYQRAVTDAKGKMTPGKGIALRWDELSDEQKADIKSNHKGEIGDEKEGETRLSFLRGDRTDEGKGYGFRIRDSRLGDIWHSSPVHVGAPPKPRWMPRIKSKEAADMFRAYLSFVRTSGGREPIVYVGANDGALHGFNAKTGEEVLSYFPAALYASLKDSKGGGYHKLANPEYAHRNYVDGTPSVFDAYVRGDGGSKQWRSVLIGSLGGGGRGFFGLDVTDPSAFSEANADDIVLGEFSNADDDHLGYSYSKARFGKMNNGRWAVIIGNGLKDTATDETGGQAQLFIVYLDGDAPGADGKWDLGTDYIRIATGKGEASAGLRNGLFTPTIVDVNGDGTIDRAYAGDLQGNLWAFDLSSKSSGAWKVALDKKPLLKAAGNRPITAAPLVVRPNHRAMGRTPRDAPGLMVAFGTGRFLEDRDKMYTDPQRFYAVYDRGVSIKKVKKQLVEQPLKESTVKTETGEERKIRLTKGKLKVPYNNPEYPKYGWYMNLPEKGERVVSEAKFARGVVYFNSIVPDISVCSSGGEGWEMAVKLVNGGNPKAGNHDVNEDEKVDGDDVAKEGGDEAPAGKRLEGRGMPTGPMLFGDRRFTATSKVDDDGSYLPETTALERIARERQGRLSWSELQPRTN